MTYATTNNLSRRLTSLIPLIILINAVVACTPADKAGEAMPVKDINAVMEAHTKSLMEIPGVAGVAIGELEDKTPCILILVIEQTPALESKLPKALEGHPVQILETGEIKPMDNP